MRAGPASGHLSGLDRAVRLTGGRSRGRRLRSPAGARTRPTSARVREALFDILGGRVPGSRFLDLFAGTGAVGLEALSRGAEGCAFVERDRAAIRLLRDNLRRAGLEDRAEVVAREASEGLASLRARGARFDILFLDPPYEPGVTDAIGRAAAALAAPGAVVVVEHRAGSWAAPPAPWGLRQGRLYRYGDTALVVLHRDRPGSEGGR